MGLKSNKSGHTVTDMCKLFEVRKQRVTNQCIVIVLQKQPSEAFRKKQCS